MKFYFIINTIQDFNFQYSLIKTVSEKNENLEIIIVTKNLEKNNKLPIAEVFLNKIKYQTKQIGISDDNIKVFNSNSEFIVYFLKLRGNIITLTNTFKSILLKSQKSIFQNWFAISYFNEDNNIYDFLDILIVSTKLDKYFIRNKKKIFVGNPYIDLFYETKIVKNFDNKVIYLIPEIVESQNWFSDIKEYILDNYSNKILYIIKLRYKSQTHMIKKKEIINFFIDKSNIIFFDSPFYDCNLNLLKLCDKIILSDKRTLFILESSFFKKKIHILNNAKINHHKAPANNAYYDYLEDNEQLCETYDNSRKLYELILSYKSKKFNNFIINLLSKVLLIKKIIIKLREKKLYI